MLKRMRCYVKLSLPITFIAFLASCNHRPSVSEIPGRYILSPHEEKDEITITADARYVHSYKARNGAIVNDSSSWSVNDTRDVLMIEFANFRMEANRKFYAGSPVPRGIWLVAVERSLSGTISLQVNPDTRLRYEKVLEGNIQRK